MVNMIVKHRYKFGDIEAHRISNRCNGVAVGEGRLIAAKARACHPLFEFRCVVRLSGLP
jgi:hypothetical protein